MISPQHADTIKQILGSKYAKKIVDHLSEHGIVRDSGADYSRQDVYQVMNSNRENIEMENAIIDLVAMTKEKRKKEMAKREALLK